MASKDTGTIFWLLFFSVIGVLAAFLLYPRYQEKQSRIAELNQERARLSQKEQQRQQLRDEVDALQNDPAAVERAAREKLGMGRQNEGSLIYEK